jgi:SAM-dependent methyltransferase
VNFKDHFSGHAGAYAKYRPEYPDELFAFLAALAPARELAWDAGTGSGQAAIGLAAHFARVHATDASAEQIARAEPHARVTYAAEPAERVSLEDGSVDLVAVAQALHWFDIDRFYAEVRRVLKPRGVLAAWCYGLCRLSPELDPVIETFYNGTVGPYWPPERCFIDERYATLPFPFEEQPAPAMAMTASWNLDEYLGYLATWSAVQRYRKACGDDPLPALHARLRPAWGDPGAQREISWPLYFRIGRVG